MHKFMDIAAMVATAVMFGAILFMLVALPGFLTNSDSTVPVPVNQVSAR